MQSKDRIYYGFLAGFLASLVRLAYGTTISLIVTPLGIQNIRWYDFAGAIIYGFKPILWYEVAFAELTVVLFQSTLGVGFAYLIKQTSSSHYIFKGALYGITLWFLIFTVINLFDVPGFEVVSGIAAVLNFLGALVYGVALAVGSKRIVSTHQSV